MCIKCVREFQPEVGQHIKMKGCDMTNFLACAACSTFGMLKSRVLEHTEEDVDSDTYTERVVYQHLCMKCEHVVAEHFYEFSSTTMQQEFTMECHLCGEGNHRVILCTTESSKQDSQDGQQHVQLQVNDEAKQDKLPQTVVMSNIMTMETADAIQTRLAAAKLTRREQTHGLAEDAENEWE